jgi:uncharacterized membrane protein YgaE (UPF0421/DUF939 family)
VSRLRRIRYEDGLERLIGFDPGLTQLRTALQAALGIGLAVAAEYVFVKATGATQLNTPRLATPAEAVGIAAQNHGLLVIAMLLGALMAMVSAFVVSDPTPRGQLITTLLLPMPMLSAMTVGLLLGPYRLPSLIFLVVALMVGTYLRRFGPRGFGAGLLIFNGGFIGFFLHADLAPHDIGWVAAELVIGMLASLVIRFGIFRPHNGRTLVRMQRSWVARSRRLIELAWRITDPTLDERERERLVGKLHRQGIRVNESTLMIDGQLAQPDAIPAAAALHERLYDLELATSNVARFAEALSRRSLSAGASASIRSALGSLHEADLKQASGRAAQLLEIDFADHIDPVTPVLIRRLAGSILMVTASQEEWLIAGREEERADDKAFTPAVGLFSGWLPGSAPISNRASTTKTPERWFKGAALAPELRATIQVGIAATIAIAVGDAVNGRRFYWGLLATFLAFMATTNSGEQVRKAVFRVAGTAVGIVLGDLLVRVTGNNTPIVLTVVIVALFLGIYLIRINYMFMVIGITVTMSQLYQQLGEFSWHLLLLRLLETGIGVAAVAFTVLLILPLRPQRVLRTGVLSYFEELQTLTNRSVDAVTGSAPSGAELALIRSDVRRLDAAHHALVTAAGALRNATFGENSVQLTKILTISTAARYYARNLANGVLHWSSPASCPDAPLRLATHELLSSMDAIARRIEGADHGVYTRSAALFEEVDRQLDDFDEHVVMRDFTMLDAAMARLASALDMDVTDHDAAAQPVSAGPAR